LFDSSDDDDDDDGPWCGRGPAGRRWKTRALKSAWRPMVKETRLWLAAKKAVATLAQAEVGSAAGEMSLRSMR
jgi:hypothetical protein